MKNQSTTQTKEVINDTLMERVAGLADRAGESVNETLAAGKELVGNFVGEARAAVEAKAKPVIKSAKKHPVETLLIAAGVGILAGIVIGRFSKSS